MGEAAGKSTNRGNQNFNNQQKLYILLIISTLKMNSQKRRHFLSSLKCRFPTERTNLPLYGKNMKMGKRESKVFVSSLQQNFSGKEFLSCSGKFPIFLSSSILKKILPQTVFSFSQGPVFLKKRRPWKH